MKNETMYYIQNGYVGNAMCWWRENSRGYTTDLESAGKYSEKEAMQIIKRPEDIAWPCSHVDESTKTKKLIIDSQYLDYNKSITTPK